ncbi:hypothetical protein FACS189450_06780 [Spirochaetia bacterium]|nr:hypothetical protein FACS189450_06780 [Spirochaetia bacterium]
MVGVTTVAGGYTGPAIITYYDDGAVVLDGAEPPDTATLEVTIRADGKLEYDPSLSAPPGGVKSLKLTHQAFGSSGKEYLIGRGTPSAGSPIVLKLEIDGELVLRTSAMAGNIPIGSYAEFQLINTVSGALAGAYEQEARLDLMGIAWSGIGDTTPFTGRYNGNSKGIRNLYYNSPTGDSPGLFSHLSGTNCEVKSLPILSGSVTGRDNVGSIAGVNEGATIIDCSISDSVTVTGTGVNVGGLVGINGGEITDCSNASDVSGSVNVGGLVGSNSGSIIASSNLDSVTVTGAGDNVGGLVGSNSGSITASSNESDITFTNAANNLGGLVGRNSGSITTSSNSGIITVTNAANNVGGLVGSNVGALAGTSSNEWVNAAITESYNSGSVTSIGDNVGGIAGLNNGAISTSYNAAGVSGRDKVGGVVGSSLKDSTNGRTPGSDESIIEYCYNEAGVKVEGKDFVGGVVGDMQEGAIFACYNKVGVTGSGYVGGVAGNMGDGHITAVYNTGAVSGTANVGGVAGNVLAGDITAVYNTGAVRGTENFVGGLIGTLNGGLMEASYNTGNVNGGVSSDLVPTRGSLAGSCDGSKGVGDSYWVVGTSEKGIGTPEWRVNTNTFPSGDGFSPNMKEKWTTGDGTDDNYWKIGTVAGLDGVPGKDATPPYPLPRLFYEPDEE